MAPHLSVLKKNSAINVADVKDVNKYSFNKSLRTVRNIRRKHNFLIEYIFLKFIANVFSAVQEEWLIRSEYPVIHGYFEPSKLLAWTVLAERTADAVSTTVASLEQFFSHKYKRQVAQLTGKLQRRHILNARVKISNLLFNFVVTRLATWQHTVRIVSFSLFIL